jgi:hypothetical protein
VFPTLAPRPNNTKVYCISSVRRSKRCNKGQQYRKLNCRGQLRTASTRFTIIRKMLIVVGIVVTI